MWIAYRISQFYSPLNKSLVLHVIGEGIFDATQLNVQLMLPQSHSITRAVGRTEGVADMVEQRVSSDVDLTPEIPMSHHQKKALCKKYVLFHVLKLMYVTVYFL